MPVDRSKVPRYVRLGLLLLGLLSACGSPSYPTPEQRHLFVVVDEDEPYDAFRSAQAASLLLNAFGGIQGELVSVESVNTAAELGTRLDELETQSVFAVISALPPSAEQEIAARETSLSRDVPYLSVYGGSAPGFESDSSAGFDWFAAFEPSTDVATEIATLLSESAECSNVSWVVSGEVSALGATSEQVESSMQAAGVTWLGFASVDQVPSTGCLVADRATHAAVLDVRGTTDVFFLGRPYAAELGFDGANVVVFEDGIRTIAYRIWREGVDAQLGEQPKHRTAAVVHDLFALASTCEFGIEFGAIPTSATRTRTMAACVRELADPEGGTANRGVRVESYGFFGVVAAFLRGANPIELREAGGDMRFEPEAFSARRRVTHEVVDLSRPDSYRLIDTLRTN